MKLTKLAATVLLFLFTLSQLALSQTTVNVRDFGAKGNGFHDDKASFEKALDTIRDGDTLYIPSGRYVIGKNNSDGLKFLGRRDVVLKGDGPQSQILYYFSSYMNGATKRPNAAILVQSSKNLTIRGISIFGMADLPNPSYSYSSDTSGILIDGSENIKLEEVSVSRMSGHGIFVTSYINSQPSKQVSIRSARVNQNRVSGVLAGNVTGLIVSESELNSNGQIGEPGTGYGFAGWSRSWSGYPFNVTVVNNQVSRNIRKGLDFHAGVNISIINNTVFENGLYGIDVEGPGLGGKILIQGNHIHSMGAQSAEMLQIKNDGPLIKANYTGQICAICIFYMKKSSPQLPNKNFEIKDNIIENLSTYSSSVGQGSKYGVYPFGLANFDGEERDSEISFSFVGNRLVNSDFTALFLQGWDGDGSKGRFDFKFNNNYIEYSKTTYFSEIFFHDAQSVEFKNNTFSFINKHVTELEIPTGTTNEERIAKVKYKTVSLDYRSIQPYLIKRIASNPNSMIAYSEGWKIPRIDMSGNTVVIDDAQKESTSSATIWQRLLGK